MKREKQRGAIATFIIVGLILAAAAVAVLYGARQFTVSQQTSPVTSDLLAQNDTSKDSDSTNKQPQASDAERKGQEAEDQKKKDKDTASAQKQAVPQKDSASSQQKAGENSANQTTTMQALQQKSQQKNNDLPKTGLTDDLLSVFGVAMVVGVFVMWRRSQL